MQTRACTQPALLWPLMAAECAARCSSLPARPELDPSSRGSTTPSVGLRCVPASQAKMRRQIAPYITRKPGGRAGLLAVVAAAGRPGAMVRRATPSSAPDVSTETSLACYGSDDTLIGLFKDMSLAMCASRRLCHAVSYRQLHPQPATAHFPTPQLSLHGSAAGVGAAAHSLHACQHHPVHGPLCGCPPHFTPCTLTCHPFRLSAHRVHSSP